MSDKGLFTGITLMPVLPFIEDTEENIVGIVKTAHECGARFVYPAFGMTLRGRQREHYRGQMEIRFPEEGLRRKDESYFRENYGCTSPNVKKLWARFVSECERYGILYKMEDICAAYKSGYDTQLSFF